MATILGVPLQDIVEGTIVSYLVGIKIFEKRRTKRMGMKPNPTRCLEHEAELKRVAVDVAGLKKDVEYIRGDIDELKAMVRRP